jgi:hypothetical protein
VICRHAPRRDAGRYRAAVARPAAARDLVGARQAVDCLERESDMPDNRRARFEGLLVQAILG